MRQPMRRAAPAAAAAAWIVVASTMAGCSEAEQVLDEGASVVATASDEALAVAVARTVRDELERQGIALADLPACTTDLDGSLVSARVDGEVRCAGRSDGGEEVTAVLGGTFGTGGCEGTLVVVAGGTEVVRAPVEVC